MRMSASLKGDEGSHPISKKVKEKERNALLRWQVSGNEEGKRVLIDR